MQSVHTTMKDHPACSTTSGYTWEPETAGTSERAADAQLDEGFRWGRVRRLPKKG